MPFKCEQRGNKWVCLTTDTGKVHGTFDSKSACVDQMRALYANVPEARKGK